MTVNEPFVNGIADAGEAGAQAIQDGFVNLPDGGVMVGVTPPTPTTTQTFQVSTTEGTGMTPPAQDPNVKYFTEADVARIRKEEKDKLYGELNETKSALKEIEKRERAREKAEQEEKDRIEAEAKAKAEQEMELRELLEARTKTFNDQLAEERAEREKILATLEMERRFTEVTSYRTQRIEQERDNILPELVNLIAGNTPEEIEASIESLRSTSASIIGNIQQAQQVARQGMPGTSVTAPPVGPAETQATSQTLTPEDIRNLPMNEYAKHRERLLGAARQQVHQNGLYG